MAKKKGRMPIRRKGALPRPRGNKKVTDAIKKGVKTAYWDAPRAAIAGLIRADETAGRGLRKRFGFEGTPITAETKFETQASPMRSMARAAKPAKSQGKRRRIIKGPRQPARGHRDVGKNEPDEDKYWMFPR